MKKRYTLEERVGVTLKQLQRGGKLDYPQKRKNRRGDYLTKIEELREDLVFLRDWYQSKGNIEKVDYYQEQLSIYTIEKYLF